MTSKSQKDRAQKTIPGGTKTKESSSKSLNDVKKSKRKSAKNYPRRNEKKRRAPQTFWRPHSYRFQASNTNNQHVLIMNPIVSTTNTNYHNCSPQLSENIHELSEIQWNVMPPRGWSTSLIPTLIATLAATLSPSIRTIRKSTVPRKTIRKRL